MKLSDVVEQLLQDNKGQLPDDVLEAYLYVKELAEQSNHSVKKILN